MIQLDKKQLMLPKQQAIIFLASMVICMLGASFVAQDKLTIWMIGASFLLLFSILNNGASMFIEDYKPYLIHSLYGFTAMLVAAIGLGMLLSGLSIRDAGSYRDIFIIILVANFLFIAMIITIKGLLRILSEKDNKLK